MISPDFTHAMGIVTKKLENPVALQLACIGSKLMISYGATSTITFGNQRIKEHFDVANIDYYDVILGHSSLDSSELLWTSQVQAIYG